MLRCEGCRATYHYHCWVTNKSEKRASSSPSGKITCSRKGMFAASTMECRDLASNLSLRAHSARVLNNFDVEIVEVKFV